MSGHRSGSLKQSNKLHKHGKHRSKGALDLIQKGKIANGENGHQKRHEQTRKDRKNRAKQLRNQKREENLNQKKLCGGVNGPSQIITLVPLSGNVDLKKMKLLLQQSAAIGDENPRHSLEEVFGPVTCLSSRYKHKFTIIDCERDLFSVIEATKYADVVVFVLSCDEMADDFGEQCLSTIRAFGMPSSICVMQGMEAVPQKNKNELKKSFLKYLTSNFQQEKLVTVDNENEGGSFLRHVSQMKRKQLTWRSSHPYIMADKVDYDQDTQKLSVSGYVRGSAMSANQTVSIRNHGVYLIEKISEARDPFTLRPNGHDKMMEGDIISAPEDHLQDSLETEREIDELACEQTWPTEEEIANGMANRHKSNVLRLPKGTSKYQASWMVEEYERSDEEYSDVNDDWSDMEIGKNEAEHSDDQFDDDDSEGEYSDIETDGYEKDMNKYDEDNDYADDLEAFAKTQQKKIDEDIEFPDEIDTPLNIAARERFRKYRGLQSFRETPWDPKEELPADYSRIYNFNDYRVLCHTAKKEHRYGVQPGTYVTIVLQDVPSEVCAQHEQSLPFVLNSLLRFENKMTLVNFVINRVADNDTTIKSKENLVFLTPQSMFSSGAIFSQNTRFEKSKFERYFHSHMETVVASVYAPIHYAPCPVLVFNRNDDGSLSMLATGKVVSCNADRIVLKRIVLTGYFYKINVKSCVLRFMFFNRDDIEWFKPIELSTKYGLKGHISEALGTHGHMKCSFNGTLRSDDTVCMNLYKRVYPNWNYTPIKYFANEFIDQNSMTTQTTTIEKKSEGKMMDFMED